ncbi:MAG: hypothetical protein HQM11_04200 [SAR324 cluster bacterium]|nr:hypothetical protein [SAR324 cluster bacterium]
MLHPGTKTSEKFKVSYRTWLKICLWILILIVAGCENDEPPKAVLSVSPGDTITVGQEYILDASESVYDDIIWRENSLPVVDCNGKYLCRLTKQVVGSFEYEIVVKTEPSIKSKMSDRGSSTKKDRTKLVVTVVEGGSSSVGSTAGGVGVSTDLTAPNTPYVSINAGNETTNSLRVTLTLTASDDVGVTGYYISESPDTPAITKSGWVSVTSAIHFSTTISYTLNVNGSQRVYAWFSDAAGNVSKVASDNIQYIPDTTSPTNPTISINKGSSTTTDLAVTLTLSATDNIGITAYYISTSSTTPSGSSAGWVSTTESTSFSTDVSYLLSGNGTLTVYAWFKDAADNMTSAASASISYQLPILSLGSSFSCALLNTGYVKCWGNSGSGQLGYGGTTFLTTPIQVLDITSASSLGTGASHACARLSSGTAKCWGEGGNGQLGNGLSVSQYTPVAVSNVTGVADISGGSTHTCAVLSSGSVQCWGAGGSGQLGDSNLSNSSTAVTVSGITSASQISAGFDHACALLSSGLVRCWGQGSSGQLGNGNASLSGVPVAVTDLPDSKQIAVGNNHSCALLLTGLVKCWGDGSSGQLGNGANTQQNSPVDVLNLTNAIQLSLGDKHSCARTSDSLVKCWGDGTSGQLGDGIASSSNIPVTVSGITSAVHVEAGDSHTCAVLSSGGIQCWGAGAQGRLGNGQTSQQNTPVSVTGL